MAKEGKKRKAQEETKDTQESVPNDALAEEDIPELAETLSKEQLLTIVKDAALSHEDVRSKLRSVADEDPAARKIFVRGLNWSTERGGLKKAFEEYGLVKDAKVIVEKSTGKSKGYGFVTFRHRDAALRAIKEPNKKIDGRNTFCNLSGAREAETAAGAASAPPLLQVSPETVTFSRKVYVGSVPKDMKKATLKNFFAQYGEIDQAFGFDKNTKQSKGYALVVYISHESVKKCLQEPVKTIDGHKVYCKLAEPHKSKDEMGMPGLSNVGYDVPMSQIAASSNMRHIAALSTVGYNAPMPSSASLLGRESAFATSSLSSLYGLPLSNSVASSHHSLSALHDLYSLGSSSLPHSSFY